MLREVSGEVVASYKHNEVTLEVVVAFPPDTPLTPVTMTPTRKIGADENKWRKWLLQMTTFLSLQNGTLLDSLLLWKNNVKKLFEGVEECTICFSVLHPTTYQLPRNQCFTCRKKFHPGCLVFIRFFSKNFKNFNFYTSITKSSIMIIFAHSTNGSIPATNLHVHYVEEISIDRLLFMF